MQYPLVGDRVLCGAARFSALSNGLVRLEWSASGQFEDAPTVCVFARPESVPFTSIAFTDEGVLHLHTELIQIVYRSDNEPFNDANLQIHWTCGKCSGTWIPSTVDSENLGGTFTSLDLIHRNFIPKGVHPASVFQSYSYTNQWLYTLLKSGTDAVLTGRSLISGSSSRGGWLPPSLPACRGLVGAIDGSILLRIKAFEFMGTFPSSTFVRPSWSDSPSRPLAYSQSNPINHQIYLRFSSAFICGFKSQISSFAGELLKDVSNRS